MRYQLLRKGALIAVLATASAASAQVTTSLHTFVDQMGTDNLIVNGDYSGSNGHVHGGFAVGGNATLGGSQINQDQVSAPTVFRVYGEMTLTSGNTVQASNGVFVQNGSTNNGFSVAAPNPNQRSVMGGGSNVFFNNVTTGVSTLASPDTFFSSRLTAMQGASTALAGTSGLAPTISNGGSRLTFDGTVGSVSVYDWDVSVLTGVNEIQVNAPIGSNVIINLKGIGAGGFATNFNMTGSNPEQASRTLFNVNSGDLAVNRTLSGSLLAPNSNLELNSQNIDGLVFVGGFDHNGGEVHNVGFAAVPEPSTYALIVGLAGLAAALGFRQFKRYRAARAA